jgi:hypothetical protein
LFGVAFRNSAGSKANLNLTGFKNLLGFVSQKPVIAGMTRNPVIWGIPAFAGMTAVCFLRSA